jgi:hypothetical protein
MAQLQNILKKYQDAFRAKTHENLFGEQDILMEIFGITPEEKREHAEYWGRELGMCWQLLVTEVLRTHCEDYMPPLKLGKDELYDCRVGDIAIDTKYRIGSGDSGTLKKFKQYGKSLAEQGLEPKLLILREDNLPSALTACSQGGWQILVGRSCFEYLHTLSNFDLHVALQSYVGTKEFSRNNDNQ